MKLTRLHVFSNDTTAESVEANQEFDQILDLSNGKLENDNFIPNLKIGWDTLHVDSPFTAFIGVFDGVSALPKTIDLGGKRVNSVLAYSKDNKSFMLGTSDGSSPINLSGVYKWETCDVSKNPDISSITNAITDDQNRVGILETETAEETPRTYQTTEFDGLEETLVDKESRSEAFSHLLDHENAQDFVLSDENSRLTVLESGSVPTIPASSNHPLISIRDYDARAFDPVDSNGGGENTSGPFYVNGRSLFSTLAQRGNAQVVDNYYYPSVGCLELPPGYNVFQVGGLIQNTSSVGGHFYLRLENHNLSYNQIYASKSAYQNGESPITYKHPITGLEFSGSYVKIYLAPGETATLVCQLAAYFPGEAYIAYSTGTDTPGCYGNFSLEGSYTNCYFSAEQLTP